MFEVEVVLMQPNPDCINMPNFQVGRLIMNWLNVLNRRGNIIQDALSATTDPNKNVGTANLLPTISIKKE